MALKVLDPLTFETFRNQAAVLPFRDWVYERVAGDNGDGWRRSVHSYSWYAYDYDLTLTARQRQADRLREADTDADWHAACERVRQWSGSTQAFDAGDSARLRETCERLDAEDDGATLAEIFADRIATSTKVYGAWNCDRWVIYDARVALRLAEFVGAWWTQVEADEPGDDFLRFPIPQPRSPGVWTPPHGFHRVGTERQGRLGFLYASWFCRLLATELGERGAAPPDETDVWTTQLVEMALFANQG
jgi:hypothetical protein